MLSNRALANFKTYLATTPPRNRGYLSAANQHGFATRARPLGAFDAGPKRAIRAMDFEKGGVLALDDSPMKQDYEALIAFLQDRLSDADQGECHTLIENLMKSCGPDSPNKKEGQDQIDPATGLDPALANRRGSDDFNDDPEAMDGRRRAGTMGLDSYPRGRGRGSLAKAEAEFNAMIAGAR